MIYAVVPMKPLSVAKQRLSPVLPDWARRALVRAMLRDVLTALQGCARVARSFVVTADLEIATLGATLDAGHIPEDAPRGLNGALETAARHLEKLGAKAMLVLPGDVPLASAAEIDQLASLSRRQGMALVPAHDREGTGALLLSPPGVLAPAFGPGSFDRHVEAGRHAGLAPRTIVLEGVGRDIDTSQDLEFLRRKTVGRPEYRFLEGAREFAGGHAVTEGRRA